MGFLLWTAAFILAYDPRVRVYLVLILNVNFNIFLLNIQIWIQIVRVYNNFFCEPLLLDHQKLELHWRCHLFVPIRFKQIFPSQSWYLISRYCIMCKLLYLFAQNFSQYYIACGNSGDVVTRPVLNFKWHLYIKWISVIILPSFIKIDYPNSRVQFTLINAFQIV